MMPEKLCDSTKSLCDWAMWYADQGYAVFPLKKDLTPATANGYKDATTAKSMIGHWWRKNPNYNIGIATGEISCGLIVIELNNDGWQALKHWQSEHDVITGTSIASDDIGNYQLYYQTDYGYKSRDNEALGVKIDANNGFVIAPPSVDPEGNRCKWEIYPDEIEPWPLTDSTMEFLKYVKETSATNTDGSAQSKTAKSVPSLSFFTASDLAKAELPEIYYPVENLIPEGETIIAAPPKSGKSWMVLQMALAVAKGNRFLGFKTHKSDVVYFALEDGDKFEQERLLKLCEASKVPDNLHYVFQDAVPLDEGFIDQLEQARTSFQNLRLVIIDTLKFVASKQKKNETAYERDYRTGQMLKSWADKHGIAVVAVTHTTKLVRPDDALANVTGTNGTTGSADAVIVIAKEKRTATDAVLAVDGRRVRQSEHEIRIDWDKCQWEYVGLADPDERERRQRQREIEDLRNSSAYKAIITLADKNVDGWKGKARKLIDDASEYGVFVTESAKEVGGMLTNNIALFAQDGVRVQIIKNGTSGNIYKLSMWQKK